VYEIREGIIPCVMSTALVAMAGKINRLIEGIIAERSKGNELLAKAVRTKLILKGINPAHYSDQSDDDPAIIKKLENMLQDFNR
jgi:hypothetical protein